MPKNVLKEKEDYQALILEKLSGLHNYEIRKANQHYNSIYAMDTELLFRFFEETQPNMFAKLKKHYGDVWEKTALNNINREINHTSRSLIDVLKNGVEFGNGVNFKLFYRCPQSTYNEKDTELWSKNIFSVMEEVYHKDGERVDLVLFLNGIAIFAIELKCNTSGQTYEDAIKQLKKRGVSRLFAFKIGVLATFAMDLNEVHFCTQLKGNDSYFLPFNMGVPKSDDKPHSIGKGNRPNKDGIRVSYMWENILSCKKIALLIERFIFIERKEDEKQGKGKRRNIKETLIFPRYHQLRAVEKLVNDIRNNRTENNYLIEHSAGSGKTNTIAWLSHILASLYDVNDKSVFDTVLIVTDRIIVDRQLQDAVSQIDYKQIAKTIGDNDNSSILAKTLKGNTKIIVTTIHKFYHILERNMLGTLDDKKFAVIIDEAHSSTEGDLHKSMTEVLAGGRSTNIINDGKDDNDAIDNDDYTLEDEIAEEIRKCGKQPNVSTIAFTATPKAGTLQLFGTLNAEGKKVAFDLYSMRQAIEEKYILNVLDNYVTIKTFFTLNKMVDDDPELDSINAKRKIARFVDVHDTNIQQKVEIIIEHFRRNIAKSLDNNAKAMVVTSSREAAVKYKLEFESYIERRGYKNIHALVAFTGKIHHNNETYTEHGMNNISVDKLRDEFDKSYYQVLIVADKYQTGFDQKKLVAMYVDKKLKGVSAVQTLSRLNRICPPYEKRTFVLDFKNEYDNIKKAFAPYYEDTDLFQPVSPSDIRDLEMAINGYEILDVDDVNEFNELLYLSKRTAKNKERMWALLDNALQQLEQKSDVESSAIRTTINRFLKVYCFIIQATCYENIDLHKKYNFLSYLVREIEVTGGSDFDIADKITVSEFSQEENEVKRGGEIESKSEIKMKKNKEAIPEVKQLKLLSAIIDEINSVYGGNYEPNSTSKVALGIRDLLLNIPRLRECANNNPLKDFVHVYEDEVSNALVAGYEQNTEFYTLLLNNSEIREKVTNVFIDEVYNTLKSKSYD